MRTARNDTKRQNDTINVPEEGTPMEEQSMESKQSKSMQQQTADEKEFDRRWDEHAARFEDEMSTFGSAVFNALEWGPQGALDIAIALDEPVSVVQQMLEHLADTGMVELTDEDKTSAA
jgi:hypothetical protein